MTPERPSVFVHLLPSLIPPGALAGGVAVVVDVLRASTVMVHALASGCEAILPCLEIEEARRAAANQPSGTALLAGERQGLPIEGFDLGNSPGDFTPEVCRGTTLVMTTTNGTRAILASQEAVRVLIGAFVNLRATARRLEGQDRPIHIVCAGTDGMISFEDSVLAGALANDLAPRFEPGNDQAQIALSLWSDFVQRQESGTTSLAEYLAQGRGGRRVRAIGLGADIEAAARMNRFSVVAELQRDPLRIVSAAP